MAVDDLGTLPRDIAHIGDGVVFFQDRTDVGDAQRGGTPGAAAHAVGSGAARQHHQQIRAETLDLRLHRRARAFTHGHHRDQGSHADEHAQHGQSGAQLIAPDGAQRRPETHDGEYPCLLHKSFDSAAWCQIFEWFDARQSAGTFLPRRLPPRGLVGDDQTVANRDDAICELRERPFVCHQYHGHAALDVEGAKCRQNVGRGL